MSLLHNGVVIVLLVAAVWYWAQRKKAASMGCALGGAIARPLLVALTEGTMGGPYRPLNVTLVNGVSLALLQMLFVAYLGTEARWSNWRVNLGIGSVTGVSLAVAQGIAAPGAPLLAAASISGALAVGGALVLVGIRTLKGRTLVMALVSAALMAVAMTVVVSAAGSV
jgi:hypothetical protein